MPQLICVGHTTYDTFLRVQEADIHCDIKNRESVVCFEFGSKIPVDDVEYGIGGGATNVAVGTTKLGISTGIYTIIGNDTRGTDVKEELNRLKVDDSWVKCDDLPTDQSAILSYDQERTLFTYSKGRIYTLKAIPDGIQAIFVSSIGSDISDLYEEIIDYKKANPNVVFFYNPGSRELKNAREDIVKILSVIDYMIANIEEGCTILNPDLKRSQIEVDDLLNLLVDRGISNVVLTDGANGSYISNGQEFYHVPSFPTDVKEKTGAGDAYSSGFISAIMHGVDLETAGKWGALNSSSSIEKLGAHNGLLSYKEITYKLNP